MKKKLNNKGFTLVELLAVFLILISVSLVAVGGITSSLEKRENDEIFEQHELAISAAKMYFALDGTGKTCVNINTLKNDGYFSDNKNLDKLNVGSDSVMISDGKYIYMENSICNE